MSAAAALTALSALGGEGSALAVGIDVVDAERLGTIVARRGQPLRDRLFTPVEQALCEGASPRYRTYCMAGRLAAKEAVRKALGPHGRGVGWLEVEIGRAASGEPLPRLSGRAQAALRLAGFGGFRLSIAHEAGVAVAIALALGAPGGTHISEGAAVGAALGVGDNTDET
ncbi:holo-ACP synthase [Streptomyces sp. NPDC093510]|uniref:holo-ACP synthase n=1 Tax=Streptomyces sp. NPDC093510 TaxID=3155199 RepID=UPI0034262575